MFYNENPYARSNSHIPSTHYKSTRLDNLKVLFIFNSIVNKLNAFKLPLLIFKESQYREEVTKHIPEVDIDSLIELNEMFKPLLGDELSMLDTLNSLYRDPGTSIYASSNDKLNKKIQHIEDYLDSSGENYSYIENLKYNPSPTQYPYGVNIIDTGIPTDLFYEIKLISEGLLVVIIYREFIKHLSQKDNFMILIKKLLLACQNNMTLEEIARLPLFTYYIKNLGNPNL